MSNSWSDPSGPVSWAGIIGMYHHINQEDFCESYQAWLKLAFSWEIQSDPMQPICQQIGYGRSWKQHEATFLDTTNGVSVTSTYLGTQSSHCRGPVTTRKLIAEWLVIGWGGQKYGGVSSGRCLSSALVEGNELNILEVCLQETFSKYSPDIFNKTYTAVPCSLSGHTPFLAYFSWLHSLNDLLCGHLHIIPPLNPCLSITQGTQPDWSDI